MVGSDQFWHPKLVRPDQITSTKHGPAGPIFSPDQFFRYRPYWSPRVELRSHWSTSWHLLWGSGTLLALCTAEEITAFLFFQFTSCSAVLSAFSMRLASSSSSATSCTSLVRGHRLPVMFGLVFAFRQSYPYLKLPSARSSPAGALICLSPMLVRVSLAWPDRYFSTGRLSLAVAL